jgi:hypothetical protein
LSALPSCAAISRGILYGRPVLGLLGSVSSSAVWCPAARRWGTAFQKACSPVHSRSHCSFSMCHNPASHWCLLPPTSSILCLSRLSSRVASQTSSDSRSVSTTPCRLTPPGHSRPSGVTPSRERRGCICFFCGLGFPPSLLKG